MAFIQYYVALAMTAVSYLLFLYLTSNAINYKKKHAFAHSPRFVIGFLVSIEVGIRLLYPAVSFITSDQDMNLLDFFVKENLHHSNSPNSLIIVVMFCVAVSVSIIRHKCEDLKEEDGNYYVILLGLFTFTMVNGIIWKLFVSTEILFIFILSLGISAYGFIRCHWARRAFRKTR